MPVSNPLHKQNSAFTTPVREALKDLQIPAIKKGNSSLFDDVIDLVTSILPPDVKAPGGTRAGQQASTTTKWSPGTTLRFRYSYTTVCSWIGVGWAGGFMRGSPLFPAKEMTAGVV